MKTSTNVPGELSIYAVYLSKLPLGNLKLNVPENKAQEF